MKPANERLRAARVRARLKVWQLAERVGLSRRTIERHESGALELKPSRLAKLLAACKRETTGSGTL